MTISPGNNRSIAQESGEIRGSPRLATGLGPWTAQPLLQPISFKSDRPLECFPDGQQPIHFVTHSLGGIIVRQLAFAGLIEKFGRVVMLSPPNQGTEVVDKLGNLALFSAISGPPGRELGTGSHARPAQLGIPPFELGVITGTRSINLFLSLMIPGPDDGKVSVKRAKLEGIKDFLAAPVTRPFIMKSDKIIEQTIHFLRWTKPLTR